MTIVQSLGSLTDYSSEWYPQASYGSLQMYDQYNYDYATLYRVQPNIRTCVDFLARNIAQLGLHVFRRVSDTDRQRLRDHPLARLISRPNEWTTRYRLIAALVSDMAIYDNAYWLKVKKQGEIWLLRVPPQLVQVSGGLTPVRYEIHMGGKVLKPSPGEIVHFRGYNPESGICGLSPLKTLRRVLAEEFSAGDYREQFWRNAARMHGIIERPTEAPEWTRETRDLFRQEFQAMYAGSANSGTTAILEEGMTWKQASFSAQESEYLAGRKLTREECARAYHIPLPMVGILDHATFSNIKEQHKNLYQDCLGPWLAMIEEEIALQLLPDFDDRDGVYCEFNIQEKMQGSFEEQITAMQSAVGRPWMTADEARARFNMPSLGGDAEQLVTPLNVLTGGQASPRDSAPDGTLALGHKALALKAAAIDPTLQQTRARHITKWAQVMAKYFERQRNAVIGRVRDNSDIDFVWLDGERWDGELTADLYSLNTATATVWAEYVAKQVDTALDKERMAAYLLAVSQNAAQRINTATRDQVAAALLAEAPKDAVKHLYDIAATSRSEQIAASGVNTAANFGSHEGAKQGGLRTKTWQHNGGAMNPRDLHVAMSGETVPIGDVFSNGARWPGDPVLGAEQNAHCNCSMTFGRE